MIESEKIELLILRQLNKEINASEEVALNAWIEKSEKNRAFYLKQLEVFKAQSLIFTQATMAESREKTKTGVINHLVHRNSKVKGFIYSSLSILLIGLVASTLLFNNSIAERDQLLAGEFKVSAPEGNPAFFNLPDGSEVWLNSNSELSFKYDVENASRLASIEGEAFFNIAHNQQRPFIVEGFNHTIKVYGTEFNMVSDRESEICEVTLQKGSVGVFDVNANEVARLKPGQQFSVDNNGEAIVKNISEIASYNDWTTGRYEFKDATLEEIATKLSSLYDVDIIISDKALKQKRYRCVLQKEQSILKTLQRFSITTDLAYDINKESITLKQK